MQVDTRRAILNALCCAMLPCAEVKVCDAFPVQLTSRSTALTYLSMAPYLNSGPASASYSTLLTLSACRQYDKICRQDTAATNTLFVNLPATKRHAGSFSTASAERLVPFVSASLLCAETGSQDKMCRAAASICIMRHAAALCSRPSYVGTGVWR